MSSDYLERRKYKFQIGTCDATKTNMENKIVKDGNVITKNLKVEKLEFEKNMKDNVKVMYVNDDTSTRKIDRMSFEFIGQSVKRFRTIKKEPKPNKPPCSICSHIVKHNDKAIFCDSCDKWTHIRCNQTTVAEYKSIIDKNIADPSQINTQWSCSKYVTESRAELFPYGMIDTLELSNLNKTNSMKLLEFIPQFDTLSEALGTHDTKSLDIDENYVENIKSDYHSCEDFLEINPCKAFSIFHSNVNGLGCHSDILNEFLVQSKFQFDALCISETTLKNDDVLADHEKLSGYNKYFHTNTLTSKGGVAIFIKDKFDSMCKERIDIKIKEKEFEAVWVEIDIPSSKNIVIGCVYRHPHINNLEEFSEYMSKTLKKPNKENKEIYISGDYNLDLLQYVKKPKIQEFYNFMTSLGYLPMILQPTRITESTISLIDNIYTNTINRNAYGGNILFQIADHLSQFIVTQNDICIPVKKPIY